MTEHAANVIKNKLQIAFRQKNIKEIKNLQKYFIH